MSTQSLDCYILPSTPMPIILPVECVAEIVAEPVIEALTAAPASWMQGHVNWRNQRLPVMSYSGLHNPELDESKKSKPLLVVLNPIPGAARKAYSALLCFGDAQKIAVEPNLAFGEIPEGGDRRYIESVIKLDETEFIVPKLTSLSVAFSYF
jgi:chemotaxis signal transduction protein